MCFSMPNSKHRLRRAQATYVFLKQLKTAEPRRIPLKHLKTFLKLNTAFDGAQATSVF